MINYLYAYFIIPLRSRLHLIMALGIIFIFAEQTITRAQDLKKLEPLPVPPQVETSSEPVKASPPEALPEKDTRVLVEKLHGLVFIDRKEAVTKRAELPPDKIDVTRLIHLQTPEFKEIAEAYIGKPVSMAGLNKLIQSVQDYYNKIDMPFVSITLPEQDITTGVVQILITEAVLGQIRVEGAKWFSEQLYLSSVRLRPGEPLRISVINDDIAWINRNPFRRANIFFDKGEGTGETNLVLRAKEHLPLRVYAGYNNNGNESTDRNQYIAGFNWGNVFGLDHQLSYQFTTSPDFRKLEGHSGSYMIPLPWRDTFTLSGAYSRIKPEMAQPFYRDGMSGSVSLRYDMVLPVIWRLQHSLAVMPEYKVADNNLLFGGIPVTDNRTDIFQLNLIYSLEAADPWGLNNLRLSFTGSPGGISERNKTKYFNITRESAKADYFYGTLDLGRMQPLPYNFSIQLNGHLQLADGNLLGSEQVGLGGVSTVRGFNEGIVYGDEGYIIRAELHTPPINVGSLIPFSAPRIPLYLLAFYDRGSVWNVDRLQDEPCHNTLDSAGVGARFGIARYLSVSFDFGWRLTDYPNVRYKSRGHITVNFSY